MFLHVESCGVFGFVKKPSNPVDLTMGHLRPLYSSFPHPFSLHNPSTYGFFPYVLRFFTMFLYVESCGVVGFVKNHSNPVDFTMGHLRPLYSSFPHPFSLHNPSTYGFFLYVLRFFTMFLNVESCGVVGSAKNHSNPVDLTMGHLRPLYSSFPHPFLLHNPSTYGFFLYVLRFFTMFLHVESCGVVGSAKIHSNPVDLTMIIFHFYTLSLLTVHQFTFLVIIVIII